MGRRRGLTREAAGWRPPARDDGTARGAVDQPELELRGLGDRRLGEVRQRHEHPGVARQPLARDGARELSDLADADRV